MDLDYFNGNLVRISTYVSPVIAFRLSCFRGAKGARRMPKLKGTSEVCIDRNVLEVDYLFCILVSLVLFPSDYDYSEDLPEAPHYVKCYLAGLFESFYRAFLQNQRHYEG